ICLRRMATTRRCGGARPAASSMCRRCRRRSKRNTFAGAKPIDFAPTELQQSVRAAIEKICARFGDDYWLKRDSDGNFPKDFYRALADDGWLGVCIPQAYGGSGLGVSEAAVMMQAVAASGAGLSGASAIHMNIFGLNPVAVYGTEEQKQRMLP